MPALPSAGQPAGRPVHPLAAPFAAPARPELTGGRRVGVLLSHGFTGQPASMRPWAEALAAEGYAVELPRLPGHGTTWQELNTRTWEDWYAELGLAFDRLRATTDAVVVGGLSMGGALVLRLAADRADEVAGVMVVNPAVATKRLDVRLLPC
jgi:carboxylesterase